MRKGIILSGGTGSRLFPATLAVSKQLLPIYDKPMIYYPLSVLMLSDIKDVLVISSPDQIANYQKLFGDGSSLGMTIEYKIQESPDGLAQAFLLGEEFIGDSDVCLILGDNFFYGPGFRTMLLNAVNRSGATVFGYRVKDPHRFGVVEFDKNQKAISIEEKPVNPKSDFAVTGLYFYDNDVIEVAKSTEPSARGELEITTVNERYLEKGALHVEQLGRGFAWFDAGTCASLLNCSNFVEAIQSRQRFMIACLEEIAYDNGWISSNDVRKLAQSLGKTDYAQYLIELLD